MSDSVQILVKKYLKYEKNEENREYIEQLVQKKNNADLERLLGTRLLFGTAGIRGRMGPGFGQMNDLVIIQTSQGLVSYLLETFGEKLCKEQGVIIGHDARHNSDRFSRLAALSFLQKSIPVYYCDQIIPTPLVAFGVRHFGCAAGIVVTASHNPKDDNGYKVYWSNGAQILSPHDKNIQNHIEKSENQAPWPDAWKQDCLKEGSHMIKEWDDIFFRVHSELSKSYFHYIGQIVERHHHQNQISNLRITYTTMHGVGHMFLTRALDIAGFEDVSAVEKQKKPDPDFPTVKFPNPEEAGALDLAFETAKLSNSNLILATDPDADRCAGAVYNSTIDFKRVLTGNEIGSILGWWLWCCYQNRDKSNAFPKSPNVNPSISGLTSPTTVASPTSNTNVTRQPPIQTPAAALSTSTSGSTDIKKKPEDCYMLSTAVSSKFLQSMAKIEGFNFVETLTGFKYMGNVADKLIQQGKCVLFAYEEAIGYMVDAKIPDKDGISASVQLAQCAAHVSLTHGRTLVQHLDWLYTKYGYHYSMNSYYLCRDQSKIRTIFHKLQTNFPKTFVYESTDKQGQKMVEEFHITRIRDLNSGFDSGTPDHKPNLPTSSSSFMVTFFVKDDITLTIRTSGTEPKIKYYSEIIVKLPNGNDQAQDAVKLEAQQRLDRLVKAAIDRCLRPQHYNLEPAAQ